MQISQSRINLTESIVKDNVLLEKRKTPTHKKMFYKIKNALTERNISVSCPKFLYRVMSTDRSKFIIFQHYYTTDNNNRNNIEGKSSDLPYAFPQQTLRK